MTWDNVRMFVKTMAVILATLALMVIGYVNNVGFVRTFGLCGVNLFQKMEDGLEDVYRCEKKTLPSSVIVSCLID